MPKIPFLSYYILPTQGIVRNNIHIGHVKEDIEALLIALSPILYIFHRDIPKPHILHSTIIQNLTIKPTTLKLLPLLGWFLNDAGEYCYLYTESSDEIAHRREAAREFRKFYNELATTRDRNPNQLDHFLSIRIMVPFVTYSLVPAQSIIKENIRLGHVKEDILSLLRSLLPLLYISHPEIPRPTVIHLEIIQKLAVKTGTLELLPLFGYIANKKQNYILRDAKSSYEIVRRTETAREFRRFYDELKKRKEDDIGIIEYYLSHEDSVNGSIDLCF